jgi:hypothetical protein
MRVAILEPEPRVCGPVIAERHLRQGFVRLGHHCDVVTSTKSGKARVSWGDTRYGAGWCAIPPEVCVRDSQLTACLASYDLVVLIEPRNPREDKRAVKEEKPRPQYIESTLACGKPYVTCLHGTDYDDKTAPFMREVVHPGSHHVTLSWRSVESNPFLMDEVKWHYSGLPYQPRHEMVAPLPLRGTVGTMGRVTPNKSPHVAMAAAIWHSGYSNYEMWGASSIGMAGNPTFDIWKMVKDWGGVGRRHGNDEESENGGDIIRPYIWEQDLVTRSLEQGTPLPRREIRVEYKGNYMDPVTVAERLEAVVALTNGNFSGGLTEFVALETMDAGGVPIVGPSTYQPDRYKVVCVESFTMAPGIAAVAQLGEGRKGKEVTALLEAVGTKLELVRGLTSDQRIQLAAYNRHQLRVHNDPAVVASTFIEAALR